MRNMIIFIACLISFNLQAQDVSQLVEEGILLHDQGRFEEAIQKYDQAIALDKNAYLAYYEKSMTLLTIKKYEECIELCKFILKNFKDGLDNGSVYANYGTALDLMGKPRQAIKIYNEGIRAFPHFGLLHFNKAVTLANTNETEEALETITHSVSFNPYHASSHHLLAVLAAPKNKVYSLMASLVFLAIEPEGRRAEIHFKNVQTILGANVQKTGDKSITMNLDPNLLNDREKNTENDFGTAELFMSMSAALNFDDKYKNESMVERLQRNLDGVFGVLNEKEGKGFGFTYYVPFFKKLKQAGYVETFCHLIAGISGDTANNAWLQENKAKLDEFNAWFHGYWAKKG